MHLKFIAILCALAVCAPSLPAAELVDGVPFDSYVNILEDTTDFAYQLRIMQAIWGQIRAEYSTDTFKMGVLYEQFQLLNATQANGTLQQQQAAYELQAAVRMEYVGLSAELVVEAINGPMYPTGVELDFLCYNVSANISAAVSVDIYTMAFSEAYAFKTPSQLAAVLYYLLEQCGSSAYETVLQTQLSVYWRFVTSGAVDEAYLLQVGYYFQQLKGDEQFSGLSAQLQENLAHAIGNLPSSLQYLYFANDFCLLNAQYWEFLYATMSFTWASGVYPVFTWGVNNTLSPEGPWTVAANGQLETNSEGLYVNFNLNDPQTNQTLFVFSDAGNEIISVANSTLQIPTTTWTIQLLKNRLIFSQNQLYMCAIDQHYNQNRRYVMAYNNATYNAHTAECQWIAEPCPLS